MKPPSLTRLARAYKQNLELSEYHIFVPNAEALEILVDIVEEYGTAAAIKVARQARVARCDALLRVMT